MPDELMPRPTTADEYVRRRAAEIIFPNVWGWLGRDNSGCSEADVMRDLMKIARLHDSGYEYAKSLEGCGWSPDDYLVDLLSDNWVEQAVDELTSQWVRCLNIQPQFKLGDSVTWRRKGEPGEIVKIDTTLAQYGVRFPGYRENSYTIVNFEDCAAVAAAESAISQGAA